MIETIRKSIVDWYKDTGLGEKLIVLVKPNFMAHKDAINLVHLSNHTVYVYAGVKFIVCAEEDFEGACILVTEGDYESTTKLRTLFHRLATNGEWLAAGKKGPKRKKALLDEAEGFADMCSGYDHYAQVVNNYFGQYPLSIPEDFQLPKYTQSINKKVDRWTACQR